MKKLIFYCLLSIAFRAGAQDASSLLQKVKAKIGLVNDYEAIGTMKTNVAFLKVPEASVKIYFKKPNLLKIKNDKGISFVPKGAVSINLNNIVGGDQYSVIDAGYEQVGKLKTRIVKLLPKDDNADIVLSTLYIDEANLVITKAKTTTRENGSYQLEMNYGKYAAWCLPDKISFTFNTRDYKLPKGVTFDFDDGSNAGKPAGKTKSGKVEIFFRSYNINRGVADAIFK